MPRAAQTGIRLCGFIYFSLVTLACGERITLSIITVYLVSIFLGIPIGIAMARSSRAIYRYAATRHHANHACVCLFDSSGDAFRHC